MTLTLCTMVLADAPAPGTAYARAHLADALIERAELEEADRVLADPHPRERVNENPFYRFSRGSHRLVKGDAGAALEDLLVCGRVLARRGGVDTPTMIPWRSRAADALLQLNDRRRARDLAEEELALAVTGGVDGAIEQAQIIVGLVESGDPGLERLHAAIDILEDSPRLLTRIRALIELGAMVRRTGQPRQAREPLRAVLDLAHHHGATALEQRARENSSSPAGGPAGQPPPVSYSRLSWILGERPPCCGAS